MRTVLSALALLAWTSLAHAEIIYVDIDATGGNDGTSWADAYADLQGALGRAVAGDEIWVAEGTYTPTSVVDPSATFSIPSGAKLYGGFAGNEAANVERDRDSRGSILSGLLALPQESSNVSEYVVSLIDADSTTTVDGFAIRDGATGLLVDGGRPALANLLVTQNRSYAGGGGGGAELRSDTSATFRDSRFVNNFGNSGGGVRAVAASKTTPPLFENVVFEDNDARYAGGGMVGKGTFLHVDFIGNNADDGGGGLSGGGFLNDVRFIENTAFNFGAGGMTGSGQLTNVQFIDNYGSGATGGFQISGPTTITNATFLGNDGFNGAIRIDSSGVEIRNSLFARNSVDVVVWGDQAGHPTPNNVSFDNVTFGGGTTALLVCHGQLSFENCVLAGYYEVQSVVRCGGALPVSFANSLVQDSGGSGPGWNSMFGIDLGGNLDAPPLFADPAGRDYRLSSDSPAIDAGNTALLPPDLLADLDGNPRVYGPTVDMGAYEFQGPDFGHVFSAQVTPETLNLGSQGNAVQVVLRPIGDVSPTEIDETTVVLLDSIPPLGGAIKAGKNQLKTKFSREALVAALEPGDAVPVTITGLLKDGRPFAATDTIRVIDPNADGALEFTKDTALPSTQTVAPRRYLRAAPNPFNPSTTIYYGVTEPGHVTLTIYDLAGRRVRTLVSGHVTSGDNEVSWDGRDETGKRVASGVYLYRLKADEFAETKRMVLVK